MKKLVKQNSKILGLILGIFFLGCSSDDNGVELPKVVAGFTFTLNADTGTAAFTNTSTNATTYAWNFGDGNTSTEASPVKSFANGTYEISLVASNNAGASDTFKDDITILLPEEGAMVSLPISFDNAAVDYSVTAFEGVAFAVVDNPDLSGTNNVASKVGSITNSGATFEGFYFDMGSDIDLTTDKTITMEFWADAAVDVLVKLEEGAGTTPEVSTSHGGTGWETMLFDFSSSDSFSRFTLFVDGPGTSAGTYYIDDIDQIATVVSTSCVAETMQSLSAADFNLTFQNDPTASIGSFDAGLTWVDNPDAANEVNSSCKVGKIDRDGSALFANNQILFDSKLDLTANGGFIMKVWSPVAGTNVLVKLEDQADAGSSTELSVATTLAGAWEELTFPFASSESNKYDFIILFFELNTNTTETYYIDDFALFARENVPPGDNEDNLITNGGFETGDTSGWETDIAGNSGVFTATNDAFKCDDYSGSFVANEAQLMIIRQANIGVGVVTPNSDITISFDLRGAAGDGGVFIAQLFSESTTAGVTKTDILNDGNPIALTDNWTRYSFTTTTGPDVTNGVTLLLKTECGAVAGCAVEANIDNVYVAVGTDSGPECDGGSTGSGEVGLNFDATSVTVNEANGTATFTASLSGAVSGGFTVDYATTDGTAVQPDDYTSTSGTLNFVGTDGESFDIVVPIIDDATEESPETFVVNLSNISNTAVIINDPQATGSITDNDSVNPGELITNGDFETGDDTGWLFFDGASISTTVNNGGNFSAEIQGAAAVARGIKQERFAIGVVQPNTAYTVSFDIIASGELGVGGIVKSFTFSEGADGGAIPATLHTITDSLSSISTSSWQTVTGTFTTAPNANQVEGGISFLIEIVNSSAKINIDNVSITLAE